MFKTVYFEPLKAEHSEDFLCPNANNTDIFLRLKTGMPNKPNIPKVLRIFLFGLCYALIFKVFIRGVIDVNCGDNLE